MIGRLRTFVLMIVRALLLAALALVGATVAAAEARLPDGTLAVPALARVTDTTGTLSAGDKQALTDKLAAFETAHGSQLAIVMVSTTQPEPIADFAQRIGDAWKIGRAGLGDGLLIVVAKDDRKIWIAVARALEGAIPDLAAKRVIREAIAPRFKQNDFAGGLSAGLDALFKLVEAEGLATPAGVPQATVDAGEDLIGLLLPFIMIGIVAAALLRKLLGVPGAFFAGGGTGAVAGLMLSSLKLGLIAGLAAFVIGLILGSGRGAGRVLGGHRRRGGIFIPGGWSGGGSGGGGWSTGGGWSSGGGGDFGGGGAGGSW